MRDPEKIREFAALVRGAERYARPYKIALVASNVLWAALVVALWRGR
jgi:hypothetical protein